MVCVIPQGGKKKNHYEKSLKFTKCKQLDYPGRRTPD